jgi:hypothetical protein
MEIKFSQVFVRPTVDIPWYQETLSEEHKQYMTDTYTNTGKRVGSVEISEDGMMMTITHQFRDQDALYQFSVDPIITQMKENRDAYNTEHNIYAFT